MKAMIFSAGFGKRLLPVTEYIPKALVTIKGRPILDWIISYLSQSGIEEIVVNTHYLADQIENFIKQKKYEVPVTIIHEKKILGTGGGLYNTRKIWGNGDFYVCNVDILCDFNLNEFYQFHLINRNKITLAVNDVQCSSMLLIDAEDNLCGWYRNEENAIFREPIGAIVKKGFCGLHFFNPEMFEFMKVPAFDSIVEQYMEWVKKGFQIKTWSIGKQYWIDMGTPANLKQAEQTFTGYGNYSPS